MEQVKNGIKKTGNYRCLYNQSLNSRKGEKQMGEKSKKDINKSQKQKTSKEEQKTKKKQDKQPKRAQ